MSILDRMVERGLDQMARNVAALDIPVALAAGQCPVCSGPVVATSPNEYADFRLPLSIRIRLWFRMIRRIDLYECEDCGALHSVRHVSGGAIGVYEGGAEE